MSAAKAILKKKHVARIPDRLLADRVQKDLPGAEERNGQ
jgi:hypothetical protein